MNNWSDFMQNPKALVLKKFLAQVLNEKITLYEDLIARMGQTLITDNDLKLFAEMVNDIIAVAYKKAIDDVKSSQNSAEHH